MFSGHMLHVRRSKGLNILSHSTLPKPCELDIIIIMSIFITGDRTEAWRHIPRSHRKSGSQDLNTGF